MTDPKIDDGQTEFVQTNLIEGGNKKNVDIWRISTDGKVSLIRNFKEDELWGGKISSGNEKWFDPWYHVRDLTELVRHARAVSDEMEEVKNICFQIEWKGLRNRAIGSISNERFTPSNSHKCQSDARTVSLCFSQAELIGNLPFVVSSLYSPIHRMFDPRYDVSPEWVERLLPSFIVQGC